MSPTTALQKLLSLHTLLLKNDEKDLLVKKGNQLHVLLLLLILLLSVVYTINNLLEKLYNEALITLIAIPIVFLCFTLLKKGYTTLSKSIKLFTLLFILTKLTLLSSPATGILSFFLPVLVGTQITFQGREKIFSTVYSIIIFLLLFFLLVLPINYDVFQSYTKERVSREWLLNNLGAAFATLIEILFLLKVSSDFQSGLITTIQEKEQLEKSVLEQQIRYQQEMRDITVKVQEKEKLALAAELHDNVNQILAASKMYMEIYFKKVGSTDEFLEKSVQLVEKALQENRSLSHSLHAPDMKNTDMVEAIKELITDLTQSKGIKSNFINELTNEELLSETKKLVLYRVAQEQITNILKHAQATEVLIRIRSGEKNISLSIKDNGVGFDLTQHRKGIGLKNIQSRVALYDGTLSIVSSPGAGCALEVELPKS